MTPVEIQLEFFDCPSKNGECWENEVIEVGYLSLFWMVNDRSWHSQAENIQAMSWKKETEAGILPFYMELNGTD